MWPIVRRELVLAGSLVSLGMLLLPGAVYVVGQAVVGEYPVDGGALALAVNIWVEALHGSPAALVLVLSPYGIVQFLRLSRHLWRQSG